MTKRLFSILTAFLLIFTLPLAVLAQDQTQPLLQTRYIRSPRNLLALAEQCRLDSNSQNLRVVLTADLDMTGTDFSGIPIFCGTFEGSGHTVSGLSLTGEGSVQGLFRYLTETALVRDLTVAGTLEPRGSRDTLGGIAGENSGTIENCVFLGTVTGGDRVGGIAGSNTLTGIIDSCRTEGSVSGDHFIGGIAGENKGVIRFCENRAGINTTPQQNSVSLSDITAETLTGSEAAGTVTDVGGIAGSSGGVIRGCTNRGAVGYRLMGYNIGGIAGSQMGYITGCTNHGPISGRKEVGGIAGQMEPAALVEYEEDALQILKRQLDAIAETANRTAANIKASTASMGGHMEDLFWQIDDAAYAVEILLPDPMDPSLPDADSFQAAQSVLGSSLSDMSHTLEGMSASTYGAAGKLSNNLHTMQNQISAMYSTLDNVSETLGGSIQDISDQDTDADLTGKVTGCTNLGEVLADLNAGGIAGAMALENDLDLQEDVTLAGESSLNFESRLRAVITDCENLAPVTVKKQNGGGIVGWMQFGLVKGALNTGSVEGSEADCIGGIAGRSSSYLRSSHAKCSLTGSTNVGGIAGCGTVVTDCRSMVTLSGLEKVGAILGSHEAATDAETPLSGNLYLTVDRDPGGIDGISYAGIAQACDREAFLALENLPGVFRRISIRFLFADGTVKTVDLPIGAALQENQIPDLPAVAGFSAHWEGLEDGTVPFDGTVTAVYTPLKTTLACGETDSSGRSILLAEGAFGPDDRITLEELADPPAPEGSQTLLTAFRARIPGDGPVTLHCRIPTGSSGNLTVLLRAEGGSWQTVDAHVDGSYLVFRAAAGQTDIALLESSGFPWPAVLGAAAVTVSAAAWILLHRRKEQK